MVRKYGFSKILVDNEGEFCNDEFETLCENFNN